MGGKRKRNEREKTSSCHGPVGPESSWINIKDIKQTMHLSRYKLTNTRTSVYGQAPRVDDHHWLWVVLPGVGSVCFGLSLV